MRRQAGKPKFPSPKTKDLRSNSKKPPPKPPLKKPFFKRDTNISSVRNAPGRLQNSRACHRCGRLGHWAKECSVPKKVQCSKCKRIGHNSGACWKRDFAVRRKFRPYVRDKSSHFCALDLLDFGEGLDSSTLSEIIFDVEQDYTSDVDCDDQSDGDVGPTDSQL